MKKVMIFLTIVFSMVLSLTVFAQEKVEVKKIQQTEKKVELDAKKAEKKLKKEAKKEAKKAKKARRGAKKEAIKQQEETK